MKHLHTLRTTLLGALCLVLGGTAWAQHNFELNNEGALIRIEPGAEVYIQGDVHMEGGSALLNNDGFIEVQGNMYSDNLFQQRGTGTVRLENNDVNINERQFIQGSYAVRGGQAQIGADDGSFYNLELANTQGMVHLSGSGNVADVRNSVDFEPAGATGTPPVNRIVTHDTATVPANGSGYSATFGMMNPAAGLGNFVNNCITANGNMAPVDNGYVQGNLRRAIASTGGVYGYAIGLEPGTAGQSLGVQYILIDFGGNNYDVVSSYFERASTNIIPGTPNECSYPINYFSGADHGEWMFEDQSGTGTGNYEMRIWPQDGTYPTLQTYFITKDNAIQGTPNDCGPSEIGLDRAAFSGFNGPSEFAFAGSTIILNENELEISASPRDNRYIEVSWTNMEEQHLSHYTLERSLDRVNFTELAEEKAIGNDQNRWSYAYDDFGVDAVNEFHYRVRYTDFDGATGYSNVVSARLHSDGLDSEVNVFPVPVREEGIHIRISAPTAKTYEVRIYDAIGRQVTEAIYEVEAGQSERTLPTQDWAAGTYFMHLRSGTESMVREIIRR